MQEVRWNSDELVSANDPGVTWLELAVSFTMWSKVLLPLRRERGNGEGYLQCFASWSDAHLFSVTLGEFSGVFSNLVQQVRKLMTTDIWPETGKGYCRSLYMLGSPTQPYGFIQRPSFPCQGPTAEYFSQYLRHHKSFDAFPPVEGLQLQLPEGMILATNWTKALKETAKGYQKVKQWRRHAQPPLRFR